jgi:heme oxygenase
MMPRRNTLVHSVLTTQPSADLLARRQANKEKKPFISAELRPYAMKLHTKEQAPKEGKAASAVESEPMAVWSPTVRGYLQFLVDSKHVYSTLEVCRHSSKLLNFGYECPKQSIHGDEYDK